MHGCLADFSDMLSHFLFVVKMVKGSGGIRTTCRLDEVKGEEMWCIIAFCLHV